MAVYNPRPAVINKRPATINARPATVNSRPATVNNRPDGGVTTNHLLDGSGNILAVTVGVDQLTNA